MEDTFYSIEEIVTITGLSKDHLTDTDGPIARICRAFPEAPFGDRKKGLTFDGLQKLNEYLAALEDGIAYEDWAKTGQPKTGGLVHVPTLQAEIVTTTDDMDGAFARLDELSLQFVGTSQEYGDYYSNLGTVQGKKLVAKFSHALADAIEEGVKETYKKIKLT